MLGSPENGAMATRRKTTAEKREAAERLDAKEIERFWREIEKLTSLVDAWKWINRATYDGKAGRMYSRLGYFLHHSAIPHGATEREIAAYEALERRALDADPAARAQLAAVIR